MKNKIFIILSMAMLGVSMQSCKKSFLEVPDKRTLLKEAYVVDLATTNDYLNGIYNGITGTLYAYDIFPYPEAAADNMKSGLDGTLSFVYNWELSTAYNQDQYWSLRYKVIRDCSFVIEKSNQYKSENESKAAVLRGQALGLRALVYSDLVNRFAQSYNFTNGGTHPGVPYITISDREPRVSRQSVSEVYDGMIKDLTEAINFLENASLSNDFMNVNSARALLARIYLFKEDYLNTKNLARQVLLKVPMMTSGYPEKLYTASDSEALFHMQPGSTSTYGAFFIGYGTGFESYYASNDIANLLTADLNDKRNAWVSKSPNNDWLITKFPQAATGLLPFPQGDHYQTVIRSSEMCLTAAEAYAKLGNVDSARFYLDAIRLRANPGSGPSSESGTALLEKIYVERRKELAFEGLRLYDLLRWKKPVTRSDGPIGATLLPYPSNKAISPIPQQDVELSGLTQNPGY